MTTELKDKTEQTKNAVAIPVENIEQDVKVSPTKEATPITVPPEVDAVGVKPVTELLPHDVVEGVKVADHTVSPEGLGESVGKFNPTNTFGTPEAKAVQEHPNSGEAAQDLTLTRMGQLRAWAKKLVGGRKAA